MNEYINDAFTREGENTNLEINNLNVGCITSTNNNFELDSNGNLVVKTLRAESILEPTILNTFHPIGSIYMSINSTDPGMIFGGVWEQIKDRFLLGCGDTYEALQVGGEAAVKLEPEHYKYATWSTDKENTDISSFFNVGTNYGIGVKYKENINTPHNNMPPYLAVYIWKRVS